MACGEKRRAAFHRDVIGKARRQFADVAQPPQQAVIGIDANDIHDKAGHCCPMTLISVIIR